MSFLEKTKIVLNLLLVAFLIVIPFFLATGSLLKSPLYIFFFRLSFFLFLVLISFSLHRNYWVLFLVLLPTLGGLFQLFIQIVTYTSNQIGFKKSSSVKGKSKNFKVELPSNELIKLIFLLILVRTSILIFLFNFNLVGKKNSRFNANNIVTTSERWSCILWGCASILLAFIVLMTIFLKNSRKSIKSSI